MDYSKVRLNYISSFAEFTEAGAPMADEQLRMAELEAGIEQGLAEMPGRRSVCRGLHLSISCLLTDRWQGNYLPTFS